MGANHRIGPTKPCNRRSSPVPRSGEQGTGDDSWCDRAGEKDGGQVTRRTRDGAPARGGRGDLGGSASPQGALVGFCHELSAGLVTVAVFGTLCQELSFDDAVEVGVGPVAAVVPARALSVEAASRTVARALIATIRAVNFMGTPPLWLVNYFLKVFLPLRKRMAQGHFDCQQQ